MSINDLYSKLTPRQLEIAIEAICSRVTGSPVDAARQIHAALAAMDADPEQPVVVLWPKEFQLHGSLLARAVWHEEERDRLLAQEASNKEASAQFWAGVRATPAGSSPQDQVAPHSESNRHLLSEAALPAQVVAVNHESPGEAHQEVRHLSSREPL